MEHNRKLIILFLLTLIILFSQTLMVTADQGVINISTLKTGDFIHMGTATKYYYGGSLSSCCSYTGFWRVIGIDAENKKALLLSDGVWSGDGSTIPSSNYGDVHFDNGDETNYEWDGSDIQTWCTNFYNNIFSEEEKNYIAEPSVNEENPEERKNQVYISHNSGYKYYLRASDLTSSDKVFFLSGLELAEYLGVEDDEKKNTYPGLIAYNRDGAKTGTWWLRSKFVRAPSDVVGMGVVLTDGKINFGTSAQKYYYARPAFYLDLTNDIPALYTADNQGRNTWRLYNSPAAKIGTAEYQTLDEAIKAALDSFASGTDEITIELLQDCSLTCSNYEIPSGKTLTINGTNGSGRYTVSLEPGINRIFTVSGTLSLKKVIFDFATDVPVAMAVNPFYVGTSGTFNMEYADIQNINVTTGTGFASAVFSDGIFNMVESYIKNVHTESIYGYTYGSGGAAVTAAGNFTMDGGKIENCGYTKKGSYSYACAGGVNVGYMYYQSGWKYDAGNAVFKNGAVITGCYGSYFGGGIEIIRGTAELTDCEISNNSAKYGGGIANCYPTEQDTSLTLNSGVKIFENSAVYGGGLFYNNYHENIAVLTADPASAFYNNSADSEAADVYLYKVRISGFPEASAAGDSYKGTGEAHGKKITSWYTDDDPRWSSEAPTTLIATDKIVTDAAVKGISLIAVPSKCTVSFNANGGGDSMRPDIVYIGEDYTVPESSFTPPDGCHFLNWNTENDGSGKTFKPGSIIKPEGDMMLYVHWSETPAELTDDMVFIEPASFVYDGTPKTPAVTVKFGDKTLAQGIDYIITESSTISAVNACTGSCYAITVKGNGTTCTGTVTKYWMISKAPSAVPKAAELSFTGSPQKLVTVESPAGGTIYYSFGSDSGPVSWTTFVPEGITAGTYYVWYFNTGDENHNGSGPSRIEVHIYKAAAVRIEDIMISQNLAGPSVSVSLEGVMPADAGNLAYAAGEPSVDGSAVISDIIIDANGQVTALISGGAAGDVISLPVIIMSENYENSEALIIITLAADPEPEHSPELPRLELFVIFDQLTELPRTGLRGKPGEKPLSLGYDSLQVELSIPVIDVISDLVTVKQTDGRYPVEWLGEDAGLLDGTALPGNGLSVIAAHNTLDADRVGPFAQLSALEENDLIIVRNRRKGQMLRFAVYANELVPADGFSEIEVIARESDKALILLTCENESIDGGYLDRRVVFAKPLFEN